MKWLGRRLGGVVRSVDHARGIVTIGDHYEARDSEDTTITLGYPTDAVNFEVGQWVTLYERPAWWVRLLVWLLTPWWRFRAWLAALALLLSACAGQVETNPDSCLYDSECLDGYVCIGVSKTPHGVCEVTSDGE